MAMPRHKSVTDEYIEELKTGFNAAAERVKTAPNWPETQKRMITGTYAYQAALGRAEQGWTREQIEEELRIRTGLGQLPNPMRLVGNRTIDE
jgi:hypothetical protein